MSTINPTTVFKAPIRELKSGNFYIDLNNNNKIDDYSRDRFMLGLTVDREEPVLKGGLIKALKDNPGTFTKNELGKVKAEIETRRTDGAQLYGDFGGGYSQTKSLDWLAKDVSPVKGTDWAISTDVNGEAWFLLTK